MPLHAAGPAWRAQCRTPFDRRIQSDAQHQRHERFQSRNCDLATPDQIAQFQQLNKSTETASKHAQNLIQPTENANRPNSSRYTDLSDAVDEAQTNIQHFVSSFSTAQQSGLKPQIKKLSKADSDLSKQSKALAQERERSQINDKKLVAVTERLDKALTGFRTELIDLGKEMGVQPEEHSP